MGRVSFVFMFLALLAFSFSFSPAWGGKPKTRKTQDERVSRTQWKKTLEQLYPGVVCKKDDYFRQCFFVDQKDCEAVVVKGLAGCFKQVKLPSKIDVHTNGIKLGREVGICAGRYFESTFSQKKKRKWECRDLKKWL